IFIILNFPYTVELYIVTSYIVTTPYKHNFIWPKLLINLLKKTSIVTSCVIFIITPLSKFSFSFLFQILLWYLSKFSFFSWVLNFYAFYLTKMLLYIYISN